VESASQPVRFDNTRIFKVKDESEPGFSWALRSCDINDASTLGFVYIFPNSSGKWSGLWIKTLVWRPILPHFYAKVGLISKSSGHSLWECSSKFGDLSSRRSPNEAGTTFRVMPPDHSET
jgi:hypothetical protein